MIKKSLTVVAVAVAILGGLSGCFKSANEKVSYRPLSLYELCDEHTQPFMQVKMEVVVFTDHPWLECLKRYPVAHDVPVNSIKVTYNKNIKMYSVRFFPAHNKAGALFYAINSHVGIQSGLSLVIGNKVVASQLGIIIPETNGFFDLSGLEASDMKKLVRVLVVNGNAGTSK